MKLNLINKIFLTITIVIVAGIAFKIIRHKGWSRYYYAASVCAPETFPVYVREIYFTTAGGREDVHMNTEKVNGFSSSWGEEESFAEATETNLLPEKLILKYASYREGSFYNDTISLPADKIKAAFKDAFKNNNTVGIYHHGQDKQGLTFLVGIANNGNIIVWVRGKDTEKEIVRFKINAKQPTENDTYYGGNLSKKEYLHDRFSGLSDSMKTLINSGFDANANYIDSASKY